MNNIVKVYEQNEVQVIGETIDDNRINYEEEILKTCCETAIYNSTNKGD